MNPHNDKKAIQTIAYTIAGLMLIVFAMHYTSLEDSNNIIAIIISLAGIFELFAASLVSRDN